MMSDFILLLRIFPNGEAQSFTIGLTRDEAVAQELKMATPHTIVLKYKIPSSKKEIISILLGSASKADSLIQVIFKLIMALYPKKFEISKDMVVEELYDLMGSTDKHALETAWKCIHMLPESLFET